MQQNLHYLLQKEMSRKEFLTIIGMAVASIFGFSTIVKMLLGKPTLGRHADGYSANDYGGKSSLRR